MADALLPRSWRDHWTQTRRAARHRQVRDQTSRLLGQYRLIRAPDQLCKGRNEQNEAAWGDTQNGCGAAHGSGILPLRPSPRRVSALPHKSSVRLRPGHVCGVIENDRKSKTGHAASVRRDTGGDACFSARRKLKEAHRRRAAGPPRAAGTVSVSMTVNGKSVSADIDPRTLLVQFHPREPQRLTGTHVGCDTSQCGACVVHLDGRATKSCTVLAAT